MAVWRFIIETRRALESIPFQRLFFYLVLKDLLMEKPSLEYLIDLARGAGAILYDGLGKEHDITHKGRIDLVTEMDHRSEDYLLERIRAQFPQHTINSEESGVINGAGQSSCWYIDPLDGTTNYAHAVPIFAVSLAYAEAGVVRLAVVYNPASEECFTAERGRGAWRNGESLHVSEIDQFADALLVTGFAYDPAVTERNLRCFNHFMRISQGVRRLGSAALDLCSVAAGRFEAYWELSLNDYDLAAGALIVEEAGGRVSRIDGSPDYLQAPHSILAANPHLYPQMLKELEKTGQTG